MTVNLEKPSPALQAFLDWLQLHTNPHVSHEIAKRSRVAIEAWLSQIDRQGGIEIAKNYTVDGKAVSGNFKELVGAVYGDV